MATIYTSDSLRNIFQSSFNLTQWYSFSQHFFNASELKEKPERIIENTSDEGYYLGNINTTDSYRIGLFHYNIRQGSVANKRVGLRNLVKSFINPTWGEFDAALVVFDSGDHWRLSFICDINGEATSPKRYTFVLGDKGSHYNTPVARFIDLQQKGLSFTNIKEAFSVEALSKDFYNKLYNWYLWALSEDINVTFPNNPNTEKDDRENINVKLIRMITRLLFVWFIKQKGLVPDSILLTLMTHRTLMATTIMPSCKTSFLPRSTVPLSMRRAILAVLLPPSLDVIHGTFTATRKCSNRKKRRY